MRARPVTAPLAKRRCAIPTGRRLVYDGAVQRAAIVCVILAASAPGAGPRRPARRAARAAEPLATQPVTAGAAAAGRERVGTAGAASPPRSVRGHDRVRLAGHAVEPRARQRARALAARGYELDPSAVGQGDRRDPHLQRGRVRRATNCSSSSTSSTYTTQGARGPRRGGDRARARSGTSERIEETARRLRDPLWTSVVAVMPVKAAAPGQGRRPRRHARHLEPAPQHPVHDPAGQADQPHDLAVREQLPRPARRARRPR